MSFAHFFLKCGAGKKQSLSTVDPPKLNIASRPGDSRELSLVCWLVIIGEGHGNSPGRKHAARVSGVWAEQMVILGDQEGDSSAARSLIDKVRV